MFCLEMFMLGRGGFEKYIMERAIENSGCNLHFYQMLSNFYELFPPGFLRSWTDGIYSGGGGGDGTGGRYHLP